MYRVGSGECQGGRRQAPLVPPTERARPSSHRRQPLASLCARPLRQDDPHPHADQFQPRCNVPHSPSPPGRPRKRTSASRPWSTSRASTSPSSARPPAEPWKADFVRCFPAASTPPSTAVALPARRLSRKQQSPHLRALHGRYWARTSDPQLVDAKSGVTPVCVHFGLVPRERLG
jgi:hypothetical protein